MCQPPDVDDQLLAKSSTAVLASGHFPHPTDEWEAVPQISKTWIAWKTRYHATHIVCKRQLLVAGTSLLGLANTATQGDTITPDTFACLDGYLDNLASATTTERTTLNQLIETNASLTTMVATLTASITALTAAYTLLTNRIPVTMQQPTTSNSAGAPKSA